MIEPAFSRCRGGGRSRRRGRPCTRREGPGELLGRRLVRARGPPAAAGRAIASMIRLVSFVDALVLELDRARRPGRVTIGRVGDVEHVGQPAAARPHLLRAPQPDRDDRRLRHGGQPRRAPAALQLGVEERRPRGIVPWGMIATIWPASRASAACLQRLVRAGAPLDPDAADGPGQLRRRSGRRTPPSCRGSARCGRSWRTAGSSPAASKYERWLATRMAAPFAGMSLGALDVEPGVREQLGSGEGQRRPAAARRSATGILGTPGGTSRWMPGQRRASAPRAPSADRG